MFLSNGQNSSGHTHTRRISYLGHIDIVGCIDEDGCIVIVVGDPDVDRYGEALQQQ